MTWRPTVLLLGPGGVKGCLELGAVSVLESYDLLRDVHTFAGVSVGALISLYLACGHTADFIMRDAMPLDFLKYFAEVTLPTITSARGAVDYVATHAGLLTFGAVEEPLERMLVERFGSVPTLAQLYARTGKRLVTVGMNAYKCEATYFSPETHPDLSCIKACTISMSIPYILQRTIYDNQWYIDGALKDPYPIQLFDRAGERVLGIHVKTEHDPSKCSPADLPTRILSTLSHDFTMQKIAASNKERCRHVCLYTRFSNRLALASTDEEKRAMYIGGVKQMRDFVRFDLLGETRPLVVQPEDLPLTVTEIEHIEQARRRRNDKKTEAEANENGEN